MYFGKGIAISKVQKTTVKDKDYYKLAMLIGDKDKDGCYDPSKVELAVIRSNDPILEGKDVKFGTKLLVEVDVSVFDGQKTVRYTNPEIIN